MPKAVIAVAISALLVSSVGSSPGAAGPSAEPSADSPLARSSPIAVTADGALLVVANPDSKSISIADARAFTPVAEVAIGCTPATVVARDGWAFAACREGAIVRVDLGQRSFTMHPGGTEPYGITEHDGRLFVSDSAAGRVRVLDRASLEETAAIDVEERPRGMAVDATRNRLFVTHFLSGRVSVVDLATLSVTRVISTGADSNLSESAVLTPDGTRAFFPQTRANAGNPALLFDTTVFPMVAAVDAATLEHLPKERFSLDVVDRPVNMPSDAVATTGGKLYVVHAGSDDLTVIDLAQRKRLAHVGLGHNPRGLALSPDERFVYVTNALSGTVSVIDTGSDLVVAAIDVTRIPLTAGVLRGKQLFHSSSAATLAKDQWISCATCHPEGGMDGRTWFFRDGPRNTPSLFGVASTLPMHWSGDLDELHDVESTIRLIQAGTGLVEGDPHCTPACDQAPPNRGRSDDLDNLARFMASLRAPRRIAEHDEASRRGEQLFFEPRGGCAGCHAPPLYTDRRRHDVGTGGPLERKGNAFDTPSLRGVAESAPYLHDGSAATLQDAVGSSRVDLQACKLEYSIVSPK